MSSQGTKNQRQEQAAATRQKLLTSAQHLFAQNGYKGTTVRMINRSVDLADGLLYHYFPGGKKEIFKEVITGNMQEMFQELQEPEKQDVYEKLPLDAALDAAYINFMTVIDEHLEFIRMMVRERCQGISVRRRGQKHLEEPDSVAADTSEKKDGSRGSQRDGF